MSSSSRTPLIDSVKGVACAIIIFHHLAFYGPMADVAQPLMPALLEWLCNYGRMAVQVFLVLGGYLAAASLAPEGMARFPSALQQIGRRFVRLVVPYAVALVLALLAAAAVRPWMEHPSVPSDPSLPQLIANALMIQDIVGEEALSAGVWYVAIDFQLFALTVLVFAAMRRTPGIPAHRAGRIGQLLVLGGTTASLLLFNRDPSLDMWAVYFWGAYGLGILAYWAVHSDRRGWLWLALMLAIGGSSLALDYRERIAVALVTAVTLVLAVRKQDLWARYMAYLPCGERGCNALQGLGRMSYSVFLVHFPVCLVVNAIFNHLWPEAPWWNAAGMVIAFALSLQVGRMVFLRIEQRGTSWTTALRWQAGLAGTGLVVTLVGSRIG